jgi:diketogulonate reductase-like aldo/keto reductase
VLSTALFIGWLNREIIPEGRLFAFTVPLAKGVMPPCVVGHGKMVGTPPVPDDMMPEPRPEHEMFLELPGGHQMPQQGLGMCCRPTAYDDVLVERTVLWYLLIGGRLIDTAHVYLNHRAIGKGIKEAIRRGVPRSEIFVTTKVFASTFGYKSTKELVPIFLEELGLEYIDLVILHSPVRFPGWNYMSQECNAKSLSKMECRHETFQALSEFRKEQGGDGLIRNVGVSNFNTQALKELQALDGAAPIANNQIMFNPFAPNESVETFHYCQQNNISNTAYFSLGGSFQHQEAQTVDTLTALSKKYDRSVAQIMLRWSLQVNAAIIPGTGNPKHMRENLSIYSFQLSNEDMDDIQKLRTDGTADKFMKLEPRD